MFDFDHVGLAPLDIESETYFETDSMKGCFRDETLGTKTGCNYFAINFGTKKADPEILPDSFLLYSL